MVLVEAMGCGCPVVSTDCPNGPAEILAGGRYGPLVPVNDSHALSEAMIQALDKPTSSDLLSARARQYSHKASGDRYLSLMLGEPVGDPGDPS
jgi:glycosyltransferase involved in cell wall biosynthesis